MKIVIGDFVKVVYNKNIKSRHMDVVSAVGGQWAIGYLPWTGSDKSFSQETGLQDVGLLSRNDSRPHFAEERAGCSLICGPFPLFSFTNFLEISS